MMKYFLIIYAFLFVSGCSKSYPDEKTIDFLLLLKLIPKPTVVATPVDATPYLFVTSGSYNGNLKGTAGNGIAGADAICATEKTANFSTLPGNASDYKAMIVDGTNRRACTSANCTTSGTSEGISWVFKASTTYYLPDKSVVLTTNGNGVVVLPNLTTGLTKAFDPSSSKKWWTGLNLDWTLFNIDYCTVWTIGTTVPSAMAGIGNELGQNSINGSFDACNNLYRLICVRQQ
ncbi:MAG: DUF1554 domain-containing protein [Leptospira sp.]|nr:DUF1554 domain-containing protein [Leptospira sp.]